jgi:hypothetical protein
MKPASRLSWVLCSTLAAVILGPSLPAIAEIDRATGLEGASAPQVSNTEEPASAKATGVGMKQEAPVQSTAEMPGEPTRQIGRSGVLTGSVSDVDRDQAPTPEATGIGR